MKLDTQCVYDREDIIMGYNYESWKEESRKREQHRFIK